eukprot:XP_016661854.1 PREDICTED: uncharacterized protein LOC107884402 [Acyrthosiphon pisum]
MDKICQYNSIFSMTSFGATKIEGDNFMPTFKIRGIIYHCIGSLLPIGKDESQFMQMYFTGQDENVEAETRMCHQSSVRQHTVLQLQNMMHQINCLEFKAALQNMPLNEYKIVINANKTPTGHNPGRFNAPTVNEMAVVIVGQEHGRRDIVIERQNGTLQRISETHRSYDALQYPFIFVSGEDGYAINIASFDVQSNDYHTTKTVSAQEFYSYRLI